MEKCVYGFGLGVFSDCINSICIFRKLIVVKYKIIIVKLIFWNIMLTYKRGDYYYLVGRTLIDEFGVCRVIQGMKEEYDALFALTKGYAGNAYVIYLMVAGSDEMEEFRFRVFEDVVKKYGELVEKKPVSQLKVILHSPKCTKWAKIYPENKKDNEKLIHL